MKKDKVLYSISVLDVENIAEQSDIEVEASDLDFIRDKIGNFMSDSWLEAIDYALEELEEQRRKAAKKYL